MKKSLLILCCLLCVVEAQASVRTSVREGNKAFEDGEYDQSLEYYLKAMEEDPNSSLLDYNAGAAYYKNQEYDQALDHFEKALLNEDDSLKQKAYYNLGNTYYQLGLANEEQDLKQATTLLESSIGEFEKSMALDLEDQDAKHNHDFVKKELVRLKKLLEKQEQENKQCPLDKDKQESSDEQKQGQKQQQDQSQQDESEKQEQQSSQQQDSKEEQQQQQGSEQDQEGQESGEQEESSADQEDGQESQQQSQAGDESEEGADPLQEKAQASDQELDPKKVSQREARMLLENYEQNDEPKKMLFLRQKAYDGRVVDQDW